MGEVKTIDPPRVTVMRTDNVAQTLELNEETSLRRGRESITMAEIQAGDHVIVSIHWGGNWGYDIPREQETFAKTLIDQGGVDIVHGHSSHHPKRMEIYRGRLILYGAGDLINDYEGIGGYEEFRPELSLIYLPRLSASGAAAHVCAMSVNPLGGRFD